MSKYLHLQCFKPHTIYIDTSLAGNTPMT